MEYIHVITNAQTGEVTQVPFTPEEIVAYEAQAAAEQVEQQDPVQKLQAFLAANPDVAQLINGQ